MPGGTSRLYAESTGVVRVFVAGEAIVRDGKATAKTQAIEKMRRSKRQRSRRSKQRSVADKRLLPSKKSLRRPPSGD